MHFECLRHFVLTENGFITKLSTSSLWSNTSLKTINLFVSYKSKISCNKNSTVYFSMTRKDINITKTKVFCALIVKNFRIHVDKRHWYITYFFIIQAHWACCVKQKQQVCRKIVLFLRFYYFARIFILKLWSNLSF